MSFLFFDRRKPIYSASLSTVLIVETARMPTTDYFLLSKVRSYGVPVRVISSSDLTITSLSGALVVFVRYIEARAKKLVLSPDAKDSLSGIAYFMDDDLLDHSSLRALPKKYSNKIKSLSPSPSWLCKHGVSLWVSSRYLQSKYQGFDPELIEPRPEKQFFARKALTRIFYHGTASHIDEINWLLPIINQVQQCCEHTAFEIIGDLSVNQLYRGTPRTSILHPMSWENYQSYCASTDLQIGLAPLLDSPFNAARSITKFFDILRCGAAGIYSDKEPFRSFIRSGEDGLLVDNHPDAWVQAITCLANTPELRERLYQNALKRAHAICNTTA